MINHHFNPEGHTITEITTSTARRREREKGERAREIQIDRDREREREIRCRKMVIHIDFIYWHLIVAVVGIAQSLCGPPRALMFCGSMRSIDW